jgi:DnaJ-class molecular chaperone
MVTRTEVKRLMNQVSAATSHYEVLDVPPGAKADTVKAAHRKLAGIFHPDRCAVTGAHEAMTRINGAYALLSDEEARRKYNVSLNIHKVECSSCAGTGFTYKQRGFASKLRVSCKGCGGTGVCV